MLLFFFKCIDIKNTVIYVSFVLIVMITILEQPCCQLCKAGPSENTNVVKQTYSELQS